MSPDVYYMELRSFLHISTTYMLILHFAACLCYSQEVYRLTERIYPTFIHISQRVRSILNIRALKVVANTWGVVNFVATVLAAVQNTPFSTEYHVHLLQYDSQWSNYLSFEKPIVKLTFRPCVLYIGQAFRYSPENAFYIFNQQIYFIIWYLLDRASLI